MTADIAKLEALTERLRFPLGLGSYDPTYDLRHEAAARIEELEKERDEALDRCDQLELEADTISAEFEKELWVNLRPVIEECGCDWRDHPDGMSAEDAVTYIRESLDSLEDGQKRAIARAEEAEKRVAELEAALRPFAKASENINPDFLDSAEIECRSAYVSGKYPGRFIITVANFSRARKALGDQP